MVVDPATGRVLRLGMVAPARCAMVGLSTQGSHVSLREGEASAVRARAEAPVPDCGREPGVGRPEVGGGSRE